MSSLQAIKRTAPYTENASCTQLQLPHLPTSPPESQPQAGLQTTMVNASRGAPEPPIFCASSFNPSSLQFDYLFVVDENPLNRNF